MEKMLKQLTDKKAVEEGVNSEFLISELAKDVVNNRCSGLRPLPTVHVLKETAVTVDKDGGKRALSPDQQRSTGNRR